MIRVKWVNGHGRHSEEGWFYERGKGPSEELKGQIIDKILETGGDRMYGLLTKCEVKLYILFDVLLCSIVEYFYELCRILASP